MARLQIRNGMEEDALKNLLEAAAVWPTNPDALQLAGEVSCVQGMTNEAVSMLLEAADRWEQAGSPDQALHARHQAFTFAPNNRKAFEALVSSLNTRGRNQASDGIMRRHASALPPAQANIVHGQRLITAFARGDDDNALAAMIQGSLEASTDEHIGQAVDEVLARAGLHELLAARWEVQAIDATVGDRAKKLRALAALHFGRLSDPERAIDFWIDALEAAPAEDQALAMLRKQASALHDIMALTEGLLRGALKATEPTKKEALLLELAETAERRAADPSLAHWAIQQAVDLRETVPASLRQALQRLEPRVKLQQRALEDAQKVALSSDPGKRKEARKRLATLLRGRPGQTARYLDVLITLISSGEGDRRHWIDMLRAASRVGAWEKVEPVIDQLWARENLSRVELAQYGMALVRVRMKLGKWKEAAQAALQLTKRIPGRRIAAALTWVLASKTGDDAARTTAIGRLASGLSPMLRAPLFAQAGLLLLRTGNVLEAQGMSSAAARANPASPQAVELAAELTIEHPEQGVDRSFERFCSMQLPEPRHMRALSQGFVASGDNAMSMMWCKRWSELAPWDEQAWQAMTKTAALLEEPEASEQAIFNLLEAPYPLSKTGTWLAALLNERDECTNGSCSGVLALIKKHGLISNSALRAWAERVVHEQGMVTAEQAVEMAVSLAATAADSEQRGHWWLRTARLVEASRQPVAFAHALVRAVESSAADVLKMAEQEMGPSTDAQLVLLRARAEALDALDRHSEAQACWAELIDRTWRDANAPTWAMSWADRLGLEVDADQVAALLVSFAKREGWNQVAEALERCAATPGDDNRASFYQKLAAILFLRDKQPERAASVLIQYVRRNPTDTETLQLLDDAAMQGAPPRTLAEAHQLVADAARGHEGKHMAHLRAATRLLDMGHPQLALPHAAAALSTKPSQLKTLTLFLGIAERTDTSVAISLLAEIWQQQRTSPIGWWVDAAKWSLAHHADMMDNLQLGLRALLSAPNRESAGVVRAIVHRAISQDPDAAPIMEMRLGYALDKLSSKLEGPVGARAAIEMVHTGIDLKNSVLALRWLGAAVSCTPDLEEYGSLVPSVPRMVEGATEIARELIDRVLSLGDAMLAICNPLLLLCEAISMQMKDTQRARALRAHVEAALAQHDTGFVDLFDEQPASSAEAAPLSPVPSQTHDIQAATNDVPLAEVDGAETRWKTDKDEAAVTNAVTLQSRLESGESAEAVRDELEAFARRSPEESLAFGQWLLTWAQAAMKAQDWTVAASRAGLALLVGKQDATLTTRAVYVQYRSCGTQDREMVREMLAKLRAVSGRTEGDIQTLHAFLMAEALEVLEGPRAAMSYLQEREAMLGCSPLLSLAQAERLSLMGNRGLAVEKFKEALRADGSLHDVRTRGQIAFAAAKTALLGGDESSAKDFYNKLVALPDTAALAAKLQEDLQAFERTHANDKPATVLQPSNDQPEPSSASSPLSSPSTLAGGFKRAKETASEPAPEQQPTKPQPGRYSWVAPERQIQPQEGHNADTERRLEHALRAGDLSAGDQLAVLLSRQGRTEAWLRVRQLQASMAPCDVHVLNGLRNAATAHHDQALADATSHAIAVLEGRIPIDAPSWEHLDFPNPHATIDLLANGLQGPEFEVLTFIWEYAAHLFVRQLTDYHLTGLDRIWSNGPHPLSAALATSAAVLNLPHVPLFMKTTDSPLAVQTLMTSPAAALIKGNLTGLDDVRFVVSQALASCLPENILASGMPTIALDQLFEALLVAFGPHNVPKERATRTAMLASELWRSLPSSAQRRCRELFYSPNAPSRQNAQKETKQRIRRASLLVTGDLAVCLRDTLQDQDVQLPAGQNGGISWQQICRASKSAEDLARLAVSAEYVRLRWQRRRPTISPYGARS